MRARARAPHKSSIICALDSMDCSISAPRWACVCVLDLWNVATGLPTLDEFGVEMAALYVCVCCRFGFLDDCQWRHSNFKRSMVSSLIDVSIE